MAGLRRWMLVMVVAVAAGCSSSQPPPTDSLQLDQPVPDLRLHALVDGQTRRLSDYRGRLVVLNLWATWCEPCRREMPALQALADRLDPKRFVVVGVSVDDDGHVAREFLLDRQIRFPNFLDPAAAQAGEQLGITLFPYTLLIAPDGRLIQRVPGAREWHADEVVTLLERAFEGDYSPLREGGSG